MLVEQDNTMQLAAAARAAREARFWFGLYAVATVGLYLATVCLAYLHNDNGVAGCGALAIAAAVYAALSLPTYLRARRAERALRTGGVA